MMRAIVLALVLVLIAGNTSIFVATMVARHDSVPHRVELPGVPNLVAVDDKLWRGAAQDERGYEALAGRGVETVIDLRAETARGDDRSLERLGLDVIHIPMRDGQAPTNDQVAEFLSAVKSSSGRVFVHCGAGVGRTGTMSAAYLVQTGGASASEALTHNLAVGPPSLEQLAFVSGMDDGSFDRPPIAVTVLSRFLDAPRRLMVRLGI
jgi:protein tyrosine phosphatase (PTP) superfamily phosphohydrolase (DUF442 family)